jgi:hypothetical protein
MRRSSLQMQGAEEQEQSDSDPPPPGPPLAAQNDPPHARPPLAAPLVCSRCLQLMDEAGDAQVRETHMLIRTHQLGEGTVYTSGTPYVD